MGYEILQAIQLISHPVLDMLLTAFTFLGEKVPLAGVFCLVYWCVDKRMGKYLIHALCASICLNGVVKDLVRAPRPIGAEGIVSKWQKSATGHSFPSGHSQSAAAFWWAFALWLRRWRYKAVALLLILAVGFSRLYLGLHFPVDVLGGILLGMLASWGVYLLVQRERWRTVYLLEFALVLACLLTGESEDTFSAGMLTLGVLLGSLFEERFVGFEISRGLKAGLLRLAVGGGLAGLVYLLPKLFLSGLLADCIPYGVIGFLAVGGCPWLFGRLRI